MGRPRVPLASRFWANVRKTDECWLWSGYIQPHGYAVVKTGHREKQYAHRVAYELTHGSIPDGLVIDHLCRNRACVNPSHLEPVTRGDNVRRGEGVSSHLADRPACTLGHAFTPENTRVTSRGRRCRACDRLYHRRKAHSHAV